MYNCVKLKFLIPNYLKRSRRLPQENPKQVEMLIAPIEKKSLEELTHWIRLELIEQIGINQDCIKTDRVKVPKFEAWVIQF